MTSLRLVTWCLLAALCGVAACHPQRFKAAENFSRGTRVFLTTPPRGRLVFFEAEYRHDLALVGDKIHRMGRPIWYFVSIAPHLRLRMYYTDSTPVRPPSYLPRMDVYALGRAGSFHARDALYMVWAGPHLTVGHHSNGQQGCTLASEEAEFDREEGKRMSSCVSTGGEPALNHLDGSFGINFVRVGFPVYMQRLEGPNQKAQVSHFIEPSMDVGTFGVDPPLMPYYPERRVALEYLYEHACDGFPMRLVCDERRIFGARLEGAMRFGVDDPVFSGRRPLSLDAEVWIANQDTGVGVFLGGYVGHDHYNIAFDETIAVAQLGFFWRHRRLRNLDQIGRTRPD
jgi:hypothetical protein